ncbi:hypothetical protein TrRE_jg11607 [Triparma retinervis]|uniref:OTU domain-containing protein n=1 Tax=Triparma retinervis TaxID=2557542 RepID=A0A9W7A7C1_9STRA|nr:hypothetical protein TrRE_jg11607 [Triparma retinervis]
MTSDGLLAKLNVTTCEAAVIMPPISERPIGLIDGRVADRTKRSNSTMTDERETSTAPILHLNFKVGEEARLVSRCSKGRAPPSTQSASTLTESAQSFRRGTSHDCSGDDDGNYDDCNVEWSGEEAHHSGNFQRKDIALDSNLHDRLHMSEYISWDTSTSTIISYLLCAVGFFATLIVRVSGCAQEVEEVKEIEEVKEVEEVEAVEAVEAVEEVEVKEVEEVEVKEVEVDKSLADQKKDRRWRKRLKAFQRHEEIRKKQEIKKEEKKEEMEKTKNKRQEARKASLKERGKKQKRETVNSSAHLNTTKTVNNATTTGRRRAPLSLKILKKKFVPRAEKEDAHTRVAGKVQVEAEVEVSEGGVIKEKEKENYESAKTQELQKKREQWRCRKFITTTFPFCYHDDLFNSTSMSKEDKEAMNISEVKFEVADETEINFDTTPFRTIDLHQNSNGLCMFHALAYQSGHSLTTIITAISEELEREGR